MPLVRREFDDMGTKWVAEIETDAEGLPYATMTTQDAPDLEVTFIARSAHSAPALHLAGPTDMDAATASRLATSLASASRAMAMLAKHVRETYRLPQDDIDGDPTKRAAAILDVVGKAEREGRQATFEEMNAATLTCSDPDSRPELIRETDALLNASVTDDENDRKSAARLVTNAMRDAHAYWVHRCAHEALLRAPADEYDDQATKAADRRRTDLHDKLITDILRLSILARAYGLDTWLARLQDDPDAARRQPTRERIAQMARDAWHA